MTENLARDPAPAGRARRIAFTVVAAIAAFLMAYLTIGSLGLLVSGAMPDGAQLTPDDRLAFLVHVPWLALGWGAAFVALIWQAARRPAAYQQALAMGASLYLGGLVLARESDPTFYIGFGVILVLLGVLHPARRAAWRPGAEGMSPLLIPFALLLAAPCTLYAVQMVHRFREGGPEAPFLLGIATTALAVPLVALAAGLRAPGWRLPLWAAGGLLFVLVGSGVAASPAAPASPPPGWAAAGLLAAIAFVALGEWEAARPARIARRTTEDPAPTMAPTH
jgi:hypothetical protein